MLEKVPEHFNARRICQPMRSMPPSRSRHLSGSSDTLATMVVRLKSILLCLLLLLLVGAPAEAAVCELTCAMHAPQPACHATPAGIEQSSQRSTAMNAEQTECGHAHRIESRAALHSRMTSCPTRICSHSVTLAVEKKLSAGGPVEKPAATATAASSAAVWGLPGSPMRPNNAPPHPFSAISSLSVVLRI